MKAVAQTRHGIDIALVPKADMRACEQITREVFQFRDIDVMPGWVMYTASQHGGLALGAYVEGGLVGYSFALPGYADGRAFLYSIGLLVRSGFEDRNVGTMLKLAQGEHAQRLGYDLVKWSVDPLASRPMYLYLSRLGARLVAYLPEIYELFALGGLDAAIVADEAEIEWELGEPDARPASGPRCRSADVADRLVTESRGHVQGGRELHGWREPQGTGPHFVELPWDLQELKRVSIELATGWRMGVRATMTDLLERGFVGTSVLLDTEASRSFVRFDRPGGEARG